MIFSSTQSAMKAEPAASTLPRHPITLAGLLTACGAVLSIATALGLLGAFSWWLDLFCHFRVQYLAGLLVVGILLIVHRRHRSAALLGLFALANAVTIAPLYFGRQLSPPSPYLPRYRALLSNVNNSSGDPARVSALIRSVAPDILVLEEVDAQWLAALAGVLRDYPYAETAPREDNFGIALFSKHRLAHSALHYLGDAGVPTVVADVELPAGPLRIVATHPVPPGGGENSRWRNQQLEHLQGLIRASNTRTMLLGDLNVTPWSVHFQRLLRGAGLLDSARGRGLQPTWPAMFPPLLIPLDHCLHSTNVYVLDRKVGPAVGSDHHPLVVEFVLAPH